MRHENDTRSGEKYYRHLIITLLLCDCVNERDGQCDRPAMTRILVGLRPLEYLKFQEFEAELEIRNCLIAVRHTGKQRSMYCSSVPGNVLRLGKLDEPDVVGVCTHSRPPLNWCCDRTLLAALKASETSPSIASSLKHVPYS